MSRRCKTVANRNEHFLRAHLLRFELTIFCLRAAILAQRYGVCSHDELFTRSDSLALSEFLFHLQSTAHCNAPTDNRMGIQWCAWHSDQPQITGRVFAHFPDNFTSKNRKIVLFSQSLSSISISTTKQGIFLVPSRRFLTCSRTAFAYLTWLWFSVVTFVDEAPLKEHGHRAWRKYP